MTAVLERTVDRHHNQAPSDEQILADDLAKSYAKDVEDYQAAVAEESFLPEAITSDEENGKYSDYDKKLSRIKSALESFRKKEKAPHSAKVAVIDSFFKSKTDNIKAIDERIGEKMKKYLKKKEDEKRRIAEEKAEAERQEAARLLKEAEAAQKAAEEAERAAKAETERVKREAEEAQRKADEDAAAVKRKADEDAAAIRKKAADDKAAADKALSDAREKEEKDRAEIKRLEEEKKAADAAARQAERDAKETIAAADKESKAIVKELKADLKAADETIADLNSEVKTLNREANNALDDAARADKSALKMERAADGKSSDFSRTRGAASLSSTSDYWTGHMTDLDQLDLEALRYHIPLDALDKAIKSCVRAGNRQIAGASIYQETRLNNR